MSGNKELVEEWIRLADQDLGTAKIIFERIPEYRETIAFHCQQAVEKYLKGTMVFYDMAFKKSHDLIYLIKTLNEEKEVIPNELKEKGKYLSEYTVDVKYPEGRYKLSLTGLKILIDIADEFRIHINSIIKF